MKEYELFVPLTYNDGSAVDPQLLADIGDARLWQSGGVTFMPQPHPGSLTPG